jgi:hypothetical protein
LRPSPSVAKGKERFDSSKLVSSEIKQSGKLIFTEESPAVYENDRLAGKPSRFPAEVDCHSFATPSIRNERLQSNVIADISDRPLVDCLNHINGQTKVSQLFKQCWPAFPNGLVRAESESDASSVKSLMLQGRELPSCFDRENNYYMLFWKSYLDNE